MRWLEDLEKCETGWCWMQLNPSVSWLIFKRRNSWVKFSDHNLWWQNYLYFYQSSLVWFCGFWKQLLSYIMDNCGWVSSYEESRDKVIFVFEKVVFIWVVSQVSECFPLYESFFARGWVARGVMCVLKCFSRFKIGFNIKNSILLKSWAFEKGDV